MTFKYNLRVRQIGTVKQLYLGGYVNLALLAVKTKSPKFETAKYSFEFRYTISNKWTHTLSMMVSVSSKTPFENYSMFQHRGMGSIFFPLNVSPMRIENIKIEKQPKLNYLNMSFFFKSPNFDAGNIEWFTVRFYPDIITNSSLI